METNELYQKFSKSTGVSIDTRTLKQNEIFFALSGPNFNGNKFAQQALSLGAKYVVIDNPSFFIEDERIILVENSLLNLQKLATYHRSQLTHTQIIALTGSNGKTTTKELIYAVLKTHFNVSCTIGNLNNHIGVPLTLLRCKKSADFLILEMGANHQGEINELSQISNPDFGLITNIGKAHLEGFGGIEGVKKGKSELYRYLFSQNKKIFLDCDDTVLKSLVPAGASIIEYHSLALKIIESNPFLTLEKDDIIFNTQITGKYNRSNIAIAIKIGEYFEIPKDKIIKGVESYIPGNNRSEIRTIKSNKVFLDAYNANPTSMKASLQNFMELNESKTSIIIIGDMLELGDQSALEHKEILTMFNNFAGRVITVGEEFHKFEKMFSGIEYYRNFQEFNNHFILDKIEKKSIFIKGSRGIGLERILN